MPRAKRPRLWLRPGKRFRDGYIRGGTWIILDQGRHIATGCAEGETERADKALEAYIAEKYRPDRRARGTSSIDVADVLAIYDADVGPRNSDPKKYDARLGRLNDFWGDRSLADVNPSTCREYVARRGAVAAARRELEDLRAAINHHARQNLHREIVTVTLPAAGQARDRWLTRDEAARLLRICLHTPEHQKLNRGRKKGELVATKKRPLRHLARFILMGVYTGTRSAALAAASPKRQEARSWVDLDRGVFYRLAKGKTPTAKRQPPVRLPGRLLAHMRRWARLNEKMEHFVEFGGEPIASVAKGFARAVELAGIAHASPHTLRHTAATWLMQEGVPTWEAAGFLGMSEKTLRDVYGHHHPDHQKTAADAVGYRHRRKPAKIRALG